MGNRAGRARTAALVGTLIIGAGMTASPSAAATRARPHTFSPATFVATKLNTGRVDIARVPDGKVLRTVHFRPVSARAAAARQAMRAPGGGLLVATNPLGSNQVWRNTRTGVQFPGYYPRVSPDGRRIATYVSVSGQEPSIRQYDARTGRVLSDLAAHAAGESSSDFEGFDWTPGSRRFVVSLGFDNRERGGLYVVDRDARVLPAKPTVPSAMIGGQWTVFRLPAMLSNGHVVAMRNVGLVDRVETFEIDDINLGTSEVHNVLGKIGVGYAAPHCLDFATATPLPTRQLRTCLLYGGSMVDASGNQALITDGEFSTWLYNGQTARFVEKGNYSAYW